MIRPMTPEDLDQVMEIEKRSYTSGWARATYEKSLASPSCRYLVEEEENRICGYAGIYLAPEEAELFTIACDPKYRRKGIASRLMDALLHILKDENIRAFFLEVRSSNEPAKSLYKKYGFTQTGIRKQYYRDPEEDALLMALEL